MKTGDKFLKESVKKQKNEKNTCLIFIETRRGNSISGHCWL